MLVNTRMPTFKNTIDILSNPWSFEFSEENAISNLPSSILWESDEEITVSDVLLWEQLYYEPGNVGVYTAYNPYAEFYLITYNLFFETELKFETFYGKTAAQQCYNRATELGIYLNFS
jgi:hypothetical protein